MQLLKKYICYIDKTWNINCFFTTTGQQKELLKCKIKDKTGVLPVSLWEKTAAQLAGVKVEDCVHIKK